MTIETPRLLLRPYTMEDFDTLYEILSDPETMAHYPAPFTAEKTRSWITWNLDNYQKYGFGLLVVTLKSTGEFIGDCGITLQNIDGEILPEIGYHIHNGDSETYYILSGKGRYNDNGTIVEIGPGDVAYCAPGEGHGLAYHDEKPVEMIALILYQ